MQQLTMQHMRALEFANEIRVQRGKDKKAIRRGHLSAAAVIKNPPRHWETAKVVDLLLALPYVGRVKAGRWLKITALSQTISLAKLSARQRDLLARHVDTYQEQKARLLEEMQRAA